MSRGAGHNVGEPQIAKIATILFSSCLSERCRESSPSARCRADTHPETERVSTARSEREGNQNEVCGGTGGRRAGLGTLYGSGIRHCVTARVCRCVQM